MHTGFAMLEGGGVQTKNRQAILIKNVMLICTSALGWWVLGYMLATGTYSSYSNFMGGSHSPTGQSEAVTLRVPKESFVESWFFGFAFAATAATIVSGAVAERINFKAYLVYSVAMTSFIYPVVAYWGWNGKGWLRSAGWMGDPSKGYMDFAGSGIVHMVGGGAGLVAAILVGPRKFLDTEIPGVFKPRFEEDGTVNFPTMATSSTAFSALGTLILWVGWMGFNPGSQFAIASTADLKVVGLAMVNTVLCPAAAACTYCTMSMVLAVPDLGGILNATLGGLVAITASCNVVEPWAAVVIGIIAAFVYWGSSYFLKVLKIDDVIDASPVHYFCGIWGVLATGLFASPKILDFANAGHVAGLFYTGDGTLLAWQTVGVLTISLWTGGMIAIVLAPLMALGCLRMSEEEEKLGLDKVLAKTGTGVLNSPKSTSVKKSEDPEPLDVTSVEVVEVAVDARTCF